LAGSVSVPKWKETAVTSISVLLVTDWRRACSGKIANLQQFSERVQTVLDVLGDQLVYTGVSFGKARDLPTLSTSLMLVGNVPIKVNLL